jgi:tetratricopeptide (TPR) repeat protein
MLPHEAFEIVHRYADKALELDSSIAESHTAKASAYLLYDWKWKEACNALLKAIDLNPAATEAYQLLGLYYLITGQHEKSVQLLEQAEGIDPLSPAVALALGNMYVFARRYEDSIKQADKLLEIDPQLRSAIEMKAWAIGMRGDWQEALSLFEEVHRLTNHPLKGLLGLAIAHAQLGNKEKVLSYIQKMEQRQAEDPHSVIDAELAASWFAIGEVDKAFYHLNQCIDKRIGPISYLLEYPAYEGIKTDPRYGEIRRRLGLPVS